MVTYFSPRIDGQILGGNTMKKGIITINSLIEEITFPSADSIVRKMNKEEKKSSLAFFVQNRKAAAKLARYIAKTNQFCFTKETLEELRILNATYWGYRPSDNPVFRLLMEKGFYIEYKEDYDLFDEKKITVVYISPTKTA